MNTAESRRTKGCEDEEIKRVKEMIKRGGRYRWVEEIFLNSTTTKKVTTTLLVGGGRRGE